MQDEDRNGQLAALLSPLFLGLSPIFGKQALVSGADPFTVAAIRMGLVVILLWIIYAIFWRKFIFIYPAGLLACFIIGATNGIGSLFYYSGLDRLDASVAQILNANYLVFVILLTRASGARIGAKTIARMLVALVGTLLITGGLQGAATWVGIGFMTGNAILFAGTVVMSQRVLYEMPAQTVTLYVMSAMAGVVIIARLINDIGWTPLTVDATFALVALAVTTAISRLLLFASVKTLGSVKAILLAIAEGAVTVSLAFIIFDDRLTTIQWVGVGIVVLSLFIKADDVTSPHGVKLGLPIPNISGLRAQELAFRKAFIKKTDERLTTQEIKGVDQIFGVDGKISTDEMDNLRQMLGEDTFKKLSGK